MNFYEHQDRAQRRTKVIVFLFALAVLLIIAVVEIPVGVATGWDPIAIGGAALFCLLIVGISTFVKLGQLRGGGKVVAEMLGGSPIQPQGANRAERQIQNIVEEMAIASGMPVPPVYVIEDDTINAFAAGWSPSDAVVGVTRGCIEQLSRDELQGVIAHEFSHISHGDMRLNIRLIGVIFGIMALGITGWLLVRFIGPAILRSTSRSRSKEGAGGAGIALGIIVFGLFLAACGAVGTLFGRLIQAAVSRQREFLADASAVQYTRNPRGIGDALRKIGGMTKITTLPHTASQCNHMFFSQAMRTMFASHPPIQERIARIEGVDITSLPETEPVASSGGGVVSHFAVSSVSGSIQSAGTVHESRVELARSAINAVDPSIKAALQSGWSARLVMFALLIDDSQLEAQQSILANVLTVAEFEEWKPLMPLVSRVDPACRLPLVDIAAPALRQLSASQRRYFDSIISALIKSDGVVDRFEWVFACVLRKHFTDSYGRPGGVKATSTLPSLSKPASIVIGALAYCGATESDEAKEAYAEAASVAGINIAIPGVRGCTMQSIDAALRQLRSLTFAGKEVLLRACETCVTHDDKVTVAEAETLRAIGDVLDCPIPMYRD